MSNYLLRFFTLSAFIALFAFGVFGLGTCYGADSYPSLNFYSYIGAIGLSVVTLLVHQEANSDKRRAKTVVVPESKINVREMVSRKQQVKEQADEEIQSINYTIQKTASQLEKQLKEIQELSNA